MTSKNSFWANCKENHKRRIWVWIVSVLGQLALYVGILMIYLSRIRQWYAQGMYRTYEEYHDTMCRAVAEALGFKEEFLVTAIVLAVIIGVQGFSYLHDRRKVDLYHSVPVEKNRRFLAVYLNGIVIYLTSTLLGVLVGVIVAAVQNAMNGLVFSEIVFALVWNLLFFLVIYHTVILAVMLTGNRIITICMAGVLIFYEIGLYGLNDIMKYAFFETVSTFYVEHEPKLSPVWDYLLNVWDLRYMAWSEGVGDLAGEVLTYCGKWLILAAVILAAAWFCYRKRPSEAAGRAIAFTKTEPMIKVLIAVPFSVGIGMFVRDASYGSTFLAVLGMLISGVIVCAAAEVIYDFDIKSMIKHPVSGGVALIGIVIVFLIYKNDLIGYDKYVPLENQVDSVALNIDYYGEFWKKDFTYYAPSDYHKEHMFITDVEPVLALASKWQQEREYFKSINNMVNVDNTADYRAVSVLYRLKSGREVGRVIWVNYADPANEALLNRIVGSDEFKAGAYQVMTDKDSYDHVQMITYTNGAVRVALPAEDAQKLRDAYVRDMEKFNFSLAIGERPCGRISLVFPNQRYTHMYVYESFENTIAYLKEQGAYYPIYLDPEDIASITITNYHYEMDEPETYDSVAEYNLAMGARAETVAYGTSKANEVTEIFDDKEQLAQIVPAIYPSYMSGSWHNDGWELDQSYDVYVIFKKDTTYPYDRSERGVFYKFYVDQVPDFVVEATAYHADTE